MASQRPPRSVMQPIRYRNGEDENPNAANAEKSGICTDDQKLFESSQIEAPDSLTVTTEDPVTGNGEPQASQAAETGNPTAVILMNIVNIEKSASLESCNKTKVWAGLSYDELCLKLNLIYDEVM